jgi:hypothetical protein
MNSLSALCALVAIILVGIPVSADVRKRITGDSEHQVRENAFKQGMDYPVGPLECDQRCSQWWERK